MSSCRPFVIGHSPSGHSIFHPSIRPSADRLRNLEPHRADADEEQVRLCHNGHLRAAAIGMLSIALALVAPQALAAQGIVQRAGYHEAWWTTADGLPGNFVTDITQGEDGRLWIIAGGVLTRFDGRAFEVVPVGEPEGAHAPMEFPTAIERGGGDTLWVSTDANRLVVRTRGLWVPMFQAEHELSELVVRPGLLPAAREDEGSRVHLWQGGRRLPAPDPGRFEATDRPSIALDAAGVLWAVERAGTIATPQVGATERQLEVATGRFVESSAGDGPLGVRRADGRLEIIDLDGRVRAAIPDGAGRVPRLLTLDGRVIASTPDHVEVFAANSRQPDPIPLRGTGPVLAAFEDREGSLWVGTNAGGLLHVRRAPFEVYQPDVQGDGPGAVHVIGPGRDGSILAVADGVARIRASRMETVSIDGVPADPRIFAATEDRRGTLWLSLTTARDERLVFARLRNGQVRRFDSAHPVVEIVEAPQGGVYWLSEVDYCQVRLRPDGTGVRTCTDIGAWGARDLLVARDGTIWIAGTRGVRAERADGARHYTPDDGYPLTRARALHEDAEGIIWIGTYYGGLGRLAGDSLRMIRSADGLAEDVVSTILEDDRGWLWMGGNAGIHGVSKASIEAFLSDEASGVSSLSFAERDGLPNAEGSGGQGVRGTDGRLWFPTFGGAVALAPDLTDVAVSHGQVRIDRITGRDTVFAVTDTLRLPSGMRELRIEIAAVSLRAPGTERIEYRMEDRAPTWTPVRDGRNLALSGLPPGSHRLEVRAIVPDVGQRLSSTRLVVVVPPRFTETAWFPVLAFAAAAVLVGLGIRYRTRLLERRARELADEVREQTHWLEVERDRSAAALERAAMTGAQLRELLVAKSRVFAGLSHELRTPMSLILAPLRELEREASGAFPPEARGHLGTLKSAVHRLERLTAQFLDLADTQSGTLRLDRRETDVGAFLERCVESLWPVAEREQVKLTLAVPPSSPIRAQLDPDQLDKVVVNLVSNAIRHAPPGGVVEVRLLADDEGEHVVLEVRDNGPGVPPECRERIFEPFFQAPGSTGGMGLGLALSRDVVVLHGGRIEVESPPGAGATFRVTLPARAPTRPEPVAGATSGPPATTEAPQPVPDEVPTGPRARLLIVEDERDLRDFLTDRFRQQYEVRTATGGEAALELVRDWTPNLVISDIMMPGLDGLALCRILKADPATRTIPVILLTALGDRDHQVRGLATGADDYVVKPFDLEQLSLRVTNLIGLRRGIEDRFQAAMPAWASILLRTGADRLDAPSEEFLERLYTTLLEGLGNPDLDVDGMAKALFLSRSSLYRRVRALLDCSPLDLLAEIRLEQAALLLRTTDDPVATIAYNVGFRNPEHFSRRFVAHFGLAPRSYRRQYRSR